MRLKRIFTQLFFIFLIFLSFSDLKSTSEGLVGEDLLMYGFSKEESNYWTEIVNEGSGQNYTIVLAPKNQAPEDITEKIVIFNCKYPNGTKVPQRNFASAIKMQRFEIQSKYINYDLTIIKQTDQELWYKIPHEFEGKPVVDLIRFVITQNGIHSFTYWKSKPDFTEQELKRAIEILEKFNITEV